MALKIIYSTHITSELDSHHLLCQQMVVDVVGIINAYKGVTLTRKRELIVGCESVKVLKADLQLAPGWVNYNKGWIETNERTEGTQEPGS